MAKYDNTSNKDQAFTELMSVTPNATHVIQVTDVPKEVSFVVVQVHSYKYNMWMSYDNFENNQLRGQYVIGTNIGLFVQNKMFGSLIEVYILNQNLLNVSCLIAVVAYSNNGKY